MATNKKSTQNSNQHKSNPQLVQNKFIRWLLIIFGTLFTVLGLVGIFLPVLPTTPFLLLAAWCYSRSSESYYNWLIGNKIFGKYIKNYREGKGIPLKVKIFAVTLLWFTILISVIFVVTNNYIRLLMIITAAVVSTHIILIKPKG